MTEDECREQNGDAHEAHMALNGECPWCGAADESQVDFGALREIVGEAEWSVMKDFM